MTHATMARPHAPRRTFPPPAVLVLAVVALLVGVVMTLALRDPDVVAQITVDNPSSLDVNVSVRPSTDGSELVLSSVPPASSATDFDVVDQGDEWIFSFSSGGVEGGTLRVTRAKLAADGWRVEVPESVARRLQTSEFVPAYRR